MQHQPSHGELEERLHISGSSGRQVPTPETHPGLQWRLPQCKHLWLPELHSRRRRARLWFMRLVRGLEQSG
ncbi:hypothetical protein KFK09_016538 [Dendrobium nobile]|uniref:Uncharacterized protein n=1 Tax=Dendrobium nobile TaxID=94219 RepID=A0A8T3AYI3_DENNO|nr:hypothetical protein KFK09_016538 [Dendrobium nobile]